jgi:SAM-dependent methyltransferase
LTEARRALSFGSVAQRYERYRLDYPDEIVDVVLAHARRPVRHALEVGAGTGKATRLFASRGIEVTALEPDPEMARVLTSTTRGLPVSPVIDTFEAHTTDTRFDAVYSASAWHWTDPATRWTRAAALLAPAGVLAVFGGPAELADPELRARVEAIEKQVLPADSPAGSPWTIEEMTGVEGLTDCVKLDLPHRADSTADDVIGRLGTVSAYLMLDATTRTDLLRRIHEALPARVALDATVHLYLARRA